MLNDEAVASGLTQPQIQQITRALREVGDFGEVRLIKVKGRVRFIQKVTSEEVACVPHVERNNTDQAR